MQFNPYLTLYGRCEEALEFYKAALGGSYEIIRADGTPLAEHTPDNWKNKVMHSTFTFPGGTFMASDGRPDSTPETESNVSLMVQVDSVAEVERIFNALSPGGKIDMELQETFWTAKFGAFTDKFGIYWMISGPNAS